MNKNRLFIHDDHVSGSMKNNKGQPHKFKGKATLL